MSTPPAGAASARKTLDELARLYPDADCALVHDDAWQLLVATILSAQSTDERVNKVTPHLFSRFPTPGAMAEAPQEEVEEEIRTIGLFRNKARHIRAASARIVEEFEGEVPQEMEDLLSLAGVARKTANVVLGVVFEIAEGIVVDTHVSRLAWKLGLTRERKNAVRIERELMKVVSRADWIVISHRLILHGRQVCIARAPRCGDCSLAAWCPSVEGPG